MEKRYEIFLSSTLSDLESERRIAIEAILSLDSFPVGMEYFAASDEEQFELIKRKIDNADYYIVIIAGRYGSIHPETGYSFTEMEYDYAVSSNTPVLTFIHRDVDKLPGEKLVKTEEAREKLMAFREKARSRKMVRFYSESFELKSEIMQALIDAPKRRPRPGWVRAGEDSSIELLSQINALQKKVTEKDKTIEELSKDRGRINSDYQWYDDVSIISGVIQKEEGNTVSKFESSISWSKLFVIMSRYFIQDGGVNKFDLCKYYAHSIVNNHKNFPPKYFQLFYKQPGWGKKMIFENRNDLTITTFANSMDSIISQFLVHGLVRVENHQIFLTEWGTRHMIELTAAKSTNEPDLLDERVSTDSDD